MFIVHRKSLGIKKSFYWWFAILTFGAAALTMHVHYCDDERKSGGPGIGRKIALLILSLAMIAGGLYLIVGELFGSQPKLFSMFLIGGGFLTFLGGYLLWVDFLAPMLGIKSEDE